MKDLKSMVMYCSNIRVVLLLALCLGLFLPTRAQDRMIGQKKHTAYACPGSRDIRNDLPEGYNELFAGSGECLLCHNNISDQNGNPVGINDDWRSTMLANAGKDPFWRAKVSHEQLVNPDHQQALQDICTRCHAPLGHFNAHHLGQEYYSIAEMVSDPLALDGVSCTLCHQITSGSLGNYSGELDIGTSKLIWGGYTNPLVPPMFNHTGYSPAFGAHMLESALCGACHTLITHSVDLNGEPTGVDFVEQALYHEWLNSDYPESGQTCQSCHIPIIEDTVRISDRPPWLGGRSPFGLHHFAGANVFMQKILRDNIEELGITAQPVHFDSIISRTSRMLLEASLELSVEEAERTADTLSLMIECVNLAGHKLPSGFPSRRIFLEILLTGQENDTIFHSGKMNDSLDLVHEDAGYEPHHEVIDAEDQVQVYEMVMGDVDSQVTTVLERGYVHLKDNRLPPKGFTTAHYSYDTAEIAGMAVDDPNFNRSGQTEGTGSDLLMVRAPVNGYSGPIRVRASAYYQTVTSRWLDEMFGFTSEEIDDWKMIYQEADSYPLLIASDSLVSLSTGSTVTQPGSLTIFPNPSRGKLRVCSEEGILAEIRIFGLNGKEIIKVLPQQANTLIDLSGYQGLCLVQVGYEDGRQETQRVILY